MYRKLHQGQVLVIVLNSLRLWLPLHFLFAYRVWERDLKMKHVILLFYSLCFCRRRTRRGLSLWDFRSRSHIRVRRTIYIGTRNQEDLREPPEPAPGSASCAQAAIFGKLFSRGFLQTLAADKAYMRGGLQVRAFQKQRQLRLIDWLRLSYANLACKYTQTQLPGKWRAS